MDIQLRWGGFDLLEHFFACRCWIIFTTAYDDEYASGPLIEQGRLPAKPVEEDDLRCAIGNARHHQQPGGSTDIQSLLQNTFRRAQRAAGVERFIVYTCVTSGYRYR